MKTCREVFYHLKNCPSCRRTARKERAADLGRLGGSVCSEAKKVAARERAKKQREAREKFLKSMEGAAA